MHIETRHFGNYAMLILSGSIADSLETSGLFDLIRELVCDNVYRVIIDMKEIKWINSTGAGALLGCYSYLDAHNAELMVINMPENVKEILSMMDLLPYFSVYPTISYAIICNQKNHTRSF